MKNFIGVCLVTLVIHFCLYQHSEITRKDHLIDLSNKEIIMLNEWVNDCESKISNFANQKTYEDGLEDGFKNYQNASYVKGYHAATTHENPFSAIVQGSEE